MRLTFRGHQIYSSIRLDEINTMVPILLLYKCTYTNENVIRGERFRLKTAFLILVTSKDLWLPEAKPLTLGQI